MSMKTITVLTGILVGVSILLLPCSCLVAEAGRGLESRLSIDMGWEQLEYEEHLPDRDLDSHGTVNNRVLGIEGLKRWRYLFGGIKVVTPLFLEDGEETWTQYGATRQTNSLEYGWRRVDGYVGYPFINWLNPYGGFRWSESTQERSEFVLFGTPVSVTAREKIKSRSLLLGIRGEGDFTPRWRWNYRLEYFSPVDVEVTNSVLKGFTVTESDGYTLELKGGAGYTYNKALSFGLFLYGGRMHWDGSGWLPFSGGTAKWPENDTDYIGGAITVRFTFPLLNVHEVEKQAP